MQRCFFVEKYHAVNSFIIAVSVSLRSPIFHSRDGIFTMMFHYKRRRWSYRIWRYSYVLFDIWIHSYAFINTLTHDNVDDCCECLGPRVAMSYPYNHCLPSNLYYKTHFNRQLIGWSFRCSWSIACRRCTNYILIIHLTPGFNILHKDNCKPRQEIFEFWDLVRLILEILCWSEIFPCIGSHIFKQIFHTSSQIHMTWLVLSNQIMPADKTLQKDVYHISDELKSHWHFP